MDIKSVGELILQPEADPRNSCTLDTIDNPIAMKPTPSITFRYANSSQHPPATKSAASCARFADRSIVDDRGTGNNPWPEKSWRKRNFRGAKRGHWHFVTGQATRLNNRRYVTDVYAFNRRQRKGGQQCQLAEEETRRR